MKVIFIGAIAAALASCSTLRYASDDYIFALKEMCSGGVYKCRVKTHSRLSSFAGWLTVAPPSRDLDARSLPS